MISNIAFSGYDGCQLVTARGLSLGVNLPPVLKQRFKKDGEEHVQGLPPFCPVELGVVDEYEGAPEHWMRGSAKAGSFFFPTAEGRGFWLDFNMNRSHKYHVAVVVSIQGVNALTGQKVVGFEPRLERYDSRCPVHDVEFGHDRYCAKCGHKWPAQNYLADTGTPEGFFWLDGFRNQDGQVRQFIFTPEEMQRGVAQNLIGKDRVFAVGIAFFLSKKPRPEPVQRSILRGAPSSVMDFDGGSPVMDFGGINFHYNKQLLGSGGGQKSAESTQKPQATWVTVQSTPPNLVLDDDMPYPEYVAWQRQCLNDGIQATHFTEETPVSTFLVNATDETGGEALEAIEGAMPDGVLRSAGSVQLKMDAGQLKRMRQAKKLEVGAGARIDQQVYPDPEALDFWRDEPEAVIYLNYADEATVQAILGSPHVDLTAGGEGFLKDVPVGDPRQSE